MTDMCDQIGHNFGWQGRCTRCDFDPITRPESAEYKIRESEYDAQAAELQALRAQVAQCWMWPGTINNVTGYGEGVKAGVKYSAHRAMLEQKLGRPILPGYLACHTCDNRACINPTHLYEGTRADNARDMVERGRAATGHSNGAYTHPEQRPRGERHGTKTQPESVQRGSMCPASKLTEADVIAMRHLHRNGLNFTAIGKEYGVDRRTVSRLVGGASWKHVTTAED